MTKETVQRVKDTKRPAGVYTVELISAKSGKVVERIEADNYVTDLWERMMLSLQYINPYHDFMIADSVMYKQHDRTLQTSALGPWYGRVWSPTGACPCPMDSLFLTNDDSTEDPTDSWLKGNVVAWAPRWKGLNSASGPRGLLNDAECEWSNDGLTHKSVWDWTTQQGNGEFQTIALGSAGALGNPAHPTFWTALGPWMVLGESSFNNTLNTYSVFGGCLGAPHIDGATFYFLANNAGTAYLYSLATSDVMTAAAMPLEPMVLNARGLTPTQICSTARTLLTSTGAEPSGASSSTSTSKHVRMGLTRLGSGAGDFVIAYTGTNGSSSTSNNGRDLKLRRFTSAGVQVWDVTIATATTSINPVSTTVTPVCSVVYDGTDLYCTAGNGPGVTSNIYRVNPATGAVTATIPLPTGITMEGWGGMVLFDGDLLCDTNAGMMRFQVDGTPATPYNYGKIVTTSAQLLGATSESGISPSGGSMQSMGRDKYGWTPARLFFSTDQDQISATIDYTHIAGIPGAHTTGASTAMDTEDVGPMFVYDGRLWHVMANMVGSGLYTAAGSGLSFVGITGANMFSRTLLPGPITKLETQNMKISYEITFPDPWDDSSRAPVHQQLF